MRQKALVEDDGTGGNVTSATAVYDRADKGSYKAETVTIQITRANCEHAKKEVKGAVKATCIAEELRVRPGVWYAVRN